MGKIILFLKKLYSKLPVISFDIFSIPLAWYLAYLFRYNMQPFPHNLIKSDSLLIISILTVVQIACYYQFKIYRGLWHFSSLNDVVKILIAIVSAVTIVIPIFYLTSLLYHIPRSVLPLYSMILATLLCGGRLLYRNYWDRSNKKISDTNSKRILVVGAGRAGEGLIRDLKRTNLYFPVGLVDDNIRNKGLEIHGVRVLGTTRKLVELVKEHQIDLIFIAIPSASSATMRRIVNQCERTGVAFRTLPSIQALASGHVAVNALREVNIEDLLGREQIELNWNKISASVQGVRVLVTGGGGSIGTELCRQIMVLNPEKLLILDNNEFNLYKIELELKNKFPDIPIELALVSVTDKSAVNFVFQKFKPEIVFHAAAFKHVPMLQDQACMAVQNNVFGTKIVAEASVSVSSSKFILISTDKAVNPSNVMGTTKRVAEIYCQNLNSRANTQFITVRFGNVLGSVGSVVPLFKKQLENGGPLTVTHPDIKRYFMTIPETCQLILQSMVDGQGGEIFVLDMGEPIKISYLAEQIIRLSGKVPGKDIKIQYTGLRPGEKLFEELFHDSESLVKTEHEKLLKAKFRQMDWNELMHSLYQLEEVCSHYQNDELIVLLNKIVPEFMCDKEIQSISAKNHVELEYA